MVTATTTTAPTGRRRRFSDYVTVWTLALIVVGVLWIGGIALTIQAATRYDATITGVAGGKCLVQWTSVDSNVHRSDVACLGRHAGDHATLMTSDPTGDDVADEKSILIVDWIGGVVLLVPALLGIGFRIVGVERSRRLAA